MREVPCGEKFLSSDSEYTVVIEVLSVFRSKLSALVPCQLLFAPLVLSHERLHDLFTCSFQHQARVWDSLGRLTDTWEITQRQPLHAWHRLMTLNWQLRRWTRQSSAARRTSLNKELHRSLKDGRSHEVHRLTQLLGGRWIGVRKRFFFHLLGWRPEQEEMKNPRDDAWRERQADMPLLEPLEMKMVTRAKTIRFSTAKELAKRTGAGQRHAGVRPQNSSL